MGKNVLLEQMLRHADPAQVAGLARFFKTGPGQYGEGDKFLGIKVPVTREVVKQCWRESSWLDLEECICSEYHEVRLAALLTLVEIFKHNKAQRQECVDFYLNHTAYINNWDLVDLSCYPLLGEWLLDKDRTLLYDLARSGTNLWEQRIGMVSTMTSSVTVSWKTLSPLPISCCITLTTLSTKPSAGCCARPGNGTRLRWRLFCNSVTQPCPAPCFAMLLKSSLKRNGNYT
jgi:hypothetical protein